MQPVSENPYFEARREWNERYGDYIKEAYSWKLAALIAISVAFLAVLGLVYIGSKSKFIPYILSTDSSGRVSTVGLPEQREPDDRILNAVISDWVAFHRSVIADEKVQRLYVDKTYAFLLPGSAGKETIDSWYLDGHDPFKKMAEGTLAVEVESVLLLSGKTYQVDWKEQSFDRNGKSVFPPESYLALLSFETRDVDASTLVKNPLGIFFINVSIQKIGV